MTRALAVVLALTATAHAAPETLFEAWRDAPSEPVALSLSAEMGLLGVLAHDLQLSQSGTDFDYVEDGGQDVLFAFVRLSADVTFADRHIVTLLYQPLELVGQTVFSQDHVFDGLTFPEGTPVDVQYSFPFWRASYMYDLADGDDRTLALGGSLQIRNATIAFTSADGTLRRSRRNIGPVPVLKVRAQQRFASGYWIATEIDGIYAPISVINGSDNEVTGAIIDASLRAGFATPVGADFFLNLRYLAGGAVGTGDADAFGSDGYNRNWLHFLTVSLGATLHIL
ncbi:MAG: hypothetical protein ACI9U2_001545 [Bradymonadia bacterium]|jgi:hypothetical protein